MDNQAKIPDLAELKLKAEAASEAMPGRWTVHRDGMGSEFPPHPDQNFGIDDSRGWAVVWHGIGRNGGIWHEEVAEFIAAVNPISVLALIAEVEALRKDAKRYRWLRLADWWRSPFCVISNPKEQAKLGSDCPSGYRLDAAIDAAMGNGEQS